MVMADRVARIDWHMLMKAPEWVSIEIPSTPPMTRGASAGSACLETLDRKSEGHLDCMLSCPLSCLICRISFVKLLVYFFDTLYS